MIAPTHRRPIWSPAELFTDREDATARFEAALDTPQAVDEYRALVWYGVGGQGKTALQDEFGRILTQRHELANRARTTPPGFALVNFDSPDNRSIALALLSLRLQLANTTRRRFPAFDTAFYRYFLQVQPGKDIKALHPELFSTGSEVLDDIIGLLATTGELGGAVFPGFNLLSKYGSRLAGKLGGKLLAWWERRGRRVLYGIDDLSPDALLRRLPTYLGADLADILDATLPPRLVIRLDTYEALWRGHALRDGAGALLADDWVRLLVQESPGVLFIITGRDELRWGEIDEDWERHLDQHLLGGLSPADADRFLVKCDIAQPMIRERMIEGASSDEDGPRGDDRRAEEGCLPFYLELQVETYWDIRGQARTPKAEDFGGDHPQILARFLNHLDDASEHLLRLASYAVSLDDAVLDHLAERFLGGSACADWHRLRARSFLLEPADGLGAPVLHSLMRDALQERERLERPEFFRRVHQALFDWFAARCQFAASGEVTPDQEQAFLTAARHVAELDEAEAVRWANRRMQRLDTAARWRTLEEACAFVLPIAERALGAENAWTTAVMSWLASAASSNGRYADAERLYERLRAIDEKVLGPEHPSTAATLHNLAQVYRETGRYADAERLYERVRAIQEKVLGPEHPSTATTLHNLARVYRDTGRYADAERLYERVRAIDEKVLGPEHPSTAATLHDLARVYSDTGRYADAERLFERVRAIQEKVLGPEHPSTAITLANLAGVYRDTGRYADAERLYERVRAIREKVLGPEHPSTAITLANLAGVYRDTGRYADAERLYERVRAIREKVLGPEHPSTAATLHNLALVYSDTGRYADAERLYERVRAIVEKTLGPEHPSTAATLANLALVYSDTGRYADAERLVAQALGILERKFATGHPRRARALVIRGQIHARVGRTHDAAADFQAALTAFAAAGIRPEQRWAREAQQGLDRLRSGRETGR